MLMRTWRGKELVSSLYLECLHHACTQMIPHAPWEAFLRSLGLFTSNICDSVNIYEIPSRSNLGRGRGISHTGVESHSCNSEHANIVQTDPIIYFLRVLHSRRVRTLYIIIKSPRDKRVRQARTPYQSAAGTTFFSLTSSLRGVPALLHILIFDFCFPSHIFLHLLSPEQHDISLLKGWI